MPRLRKPLAGASSAGAPPPGAERDPPRTPSPSRSRRPSVHEWGRIEQVVSPNPTFRARNLHEEEVDGSWEEPRSVAVAVALLGAAVLLSTETVQSQLGLSPFQAAAVAGAAALILYGILHLRDGSLVYPHPMLWRVVHAVNQCYLLLLVTMMALGPEHGKGLLTTLVPALAGSADAFDYQATLSTGTGDDCGLTWDGAQKQLFSIWFISHTLGFIGKAWIFRDWRFVLVFSVAFECFECSMAWLVPEFVECWWDSLFFDALGANMIGLVIGFGWIRYSGAYTYDFFRKSPSNTPYSEAGKDTFEWRFVESWDRFWCVGFMLLGSVGMEAMAFFLIHSLQIPKTHWFNVTRLASLSLLAMPGIREHYLYMEAPVKKRRVGPNVWLLLVIIAAEATLVVRFGRPGGWAGSHPPVEVWGPLLGFAVMGLLFLKIRIDRIERGARRSAAGKAGESESPSWLETTLLYTTLLPLTMLSKQWNWSAGDKSFH